MLLPFKNFYETFDTAHQVNEGDFTGKSLGLTSKMWIMRSGKLYSCGGQMHYQWALSKQRELTKNHGIDLEGFTYADDEQPVRVHLIKQGMFRVNHEHRGNRVTIEGCKRFFNRRVKDTIVNLVMENSGYFGSLTINLFNQDATQVVDRKGVNLFSMSEQKKVNAVSEELY
jgi:hypothetical protein